MFTDQHGRVIRPYRPPKPAGRPLPKAARSHSITTDPYQHPLGEQLDSWAVHFQVAS